MLHNNVIDQKGGFRTLEAAELDAVSGGDIDLGGDILELVDTIRNGFNYMVDPEGTGEDIINERVTELGLENGGLQYLGNFADGHYVQIGDTGYIAIDRDKNGEYDLIAISNGDMWTYVTGTGDVLNYSQGPQYLDLNTLPWLASGGLDTTFGTFGGGA